jgi:hypothetical protein
LKQYDQAKNLASEEYYRNRHRGKQNAVNVVNDERGRLSLDPAFQHKIKFKAAGSGAETNNPDLASVEWLDQN